MCVRAQAKSQQALRFSSDSLRQFHVKSFGYFANEPHQLRSWRRFLPERLDAETLVCGYAHATTKPSSCFKAPFSLLLLERGAARDNAFKRGTNNCLKRRRSRAEAERNNSVAQRRSGEELLTRRN